MLKSYSINIYSNNNSCKLITTMQNVPFKALKEFISNGRYSFSSIDIYEISYDTNTKELIDLGYGNSKYLASFTNISENEARNLIDDCCLSDVSLINY